jgi:hypothetical protein
VQEDTINSHIIFNVRFFTRDGIQLAQYLPCVNDSTRHRPLLVQSKGAHSSELYDVTPYRTWSASMRTQIKIKEPNSTESCKTGSHTRCCITILTYTCHLAQICMASRIQFSYYCCSLPFHTDFHDVITWG